MARKAQSTKPVRKGVSRIESAAKKERFAALCAVMPAERAKVLAGYSPRTNIDKIKNTPEVLETVAQVRERLQQTKGYRLEDSAKFYKDIAEDEKRVAVSDRLRSRTRLDNLLGLDAPQKMEVHETQELTQAVMILSNLPINPQQLAKTIKNYTPTSTHVEGSEANPLICNGDEDESN